MQVTPPPPSHLTLSEFVPLTATSSLPFLVTKVTSLTGSGCPLRLSHRPLRSQQGVVCQEVESFSSGKRCTSASKQGGEECRSLFLTKVEWDYFLQHT